MTIELKLQETEQIEDSGLRELVVVVHEMLQYYHKGFVGALTVISGGVEMFHSDGNKEHLQDAEKSLHEIEELYSRIPFEALQIREYAPLFVVRDLLSELRNQFEVLKKHRDDEFALRFIQDYLIAMREVGKFYKRSITEKIEKIRAFPEWENFNFSITDRNGNEWSVKYFLPIR